MSNLRAALIILALLVVAFVPISCRQEGIRVGSKKFTESVILGEIMTQLATSTGTPAIHVDEIGGTSQLFQYLLVGDIDVYPDYTGTIQLELLAREKPETLQEVRELLGGQGIRMSEPLGFNNGYALGMLRDRAEALGIERVSDLTRHADLRFGLTSEFISREDGWPGLRSRYGLRQQDVRGMDHDIAYRALKNNDIDVMDVYTTDAKIEVLDIKMLEDDLQYFSDYQAVLLFREDTPQRYPQAWSAIERLQGAIAEKDMMYMNSRADFDMVAEPLVAAEWLRDALGIEQVVRTQRPMQRVWLYTLEHVDLVRKSLIPAIIVGIALGIVSYKRRWLGQFIMGLAGIALTIPALALLALLFPLVAYLVERAGTQGSGVATAYVALFLYSLLPIIRNTFTGLVSIDRGLLDSADALGLPRIERMKQIELPLAMRSILAGIKTAAVLNIGFATLGALVGAGGYGAPVLTGLRRFDTFEILLGAVPAALMALACQLLFDVAERWLVPRGLRLEPLN